MQESGTRTSVHAGPQAQSAGWRVETEQGAVEPRSLLAVADEVDRRIRTGDLSSLQPIATGFEPLDRWIGGGLRPGELMLIGGVQAVGKTTFALQAARNIALAGRATVLYVCFEHDEEFLLARLIAQESIDPAAERSIGLRVRDIQARILEVRRQYAVGLREILAADERGRRALAKIDAYGHRLFLLKASGYRATVSTLHRLVQQHRERSSDRLVLFVDYLQKIPVYPAPADEAEKVTRVVEGLKELAVSQGITVCAIVAADKEGLKARRLHLHHLRGSSALSYEADIALILNEKYRIVAKVNIEYNLQKAQSYHNWVVCTLEKNRSGREQLDMQFQQHFEYCAFNPNGAGIQETLIDDRVITE